MTDADMTEKNTILRIASSLTTFLVACVVLNAFASISKPFIFGILSGGTMAQWANYMTFSYCGPFRKPAAVIVWVVGMGIIAFLMTLCNYVFQHSVY